MPPLTVGQEIKNLVDFASNDYLGLARCPVQRMLVEKAYHRVSKTADQPALGSMDGDIAPLRKMLDLCQETGAILMVDEAHGHGVYGKTNVQDISLESDDGVDNDTCKKMLDKPEGGTGVLAALNLEHHPSLFCSIHTFGKAAGCHGAVVVGSNTLVSYLVNYARPFVYSTALPLHSLISIQQSYRSITGFEGEKRRCAVFRIVKYFRREIVCGLLALEISDRVTMYVREAGGLDVYPIRSPTVPKGEERIRIILHTHNTDDEIRHPAHDILTTNSRQTHDKLMTLHDTMFGYYDNLRQTHDKFTTPHDKLTYIFKLRSRLLTPYDESCGDSNPDSKICSRILSNLLNKEDDADVTFDVKGQMMYAHTIILKERAPDLVTDFCDDACDKSHPVPIQDVDPEIFKAMLQHAYAHNIHSTMWRDHTKEILEASGKYDFNEFKSEAEALYMKSEITVDSVIYELLYADSYNLPLSKKAAMDFILKHGEEVSVSDSYDRLDESPKLRKEVMVAAFKRSKKRQRDSDEDED
eukprot:scaffold3320_cov64-Cyclotella_meneghiniana.AAC.5